MLVLREMGPRPGCGIVCPALFMITIKIMISDYDYLFLNVIMVTIT